MGDRNNSTLSQEIIQAVTNVGIRFEDVMAIVRGIVKKSIVMFSPQSFHNHALLTLLILQLRFSTIFRIFNIPQTSLP